MVIKSNFTQSSGSIGFFFQVLKRLESIILAVIFVKEDPRYYASKNRKSSLKAVENVLYFFARSFMFGLIIQKDATNATLHHENFFLMQKQRERNQMSSLDKLRQCVNLLIFITTRLGLRPNVESEGGESK